ncbi:MAG: hypothetical protein KatS3mg110_1722 [Pirellulaceae bacterium]|nr:MAG: hypothetical protein KatS3mg110_1722 [Pirellulaceae bacterium]
MHVPQTVHRASRLFVAGVHWKRIFDGLLALLLMGTALLLGGREEPGRLFFLVMAFALGLFTCLWQRFDRHRVWFWTGAELLLIAGLLVLVVQMVPLPASWLQKLSPVLHTSLPIWYESSPAGWWLPWRTVSLAPFQTRESLVVLAAYGVLFLSVCQRLEDRCDLDRLLWIVAGATLVVACVGWAQFLSGTDRYLWCYHHPHRSAQGILTGSFTNRNHFAHFLLLGGVSVAYVTFYHAAHQANWKRVVGWIALGAIALAVLLSLSRGAWLAGTVGSAVGVGVALGRRWQQRRLLAGVALLAGVMAIALAIYGAKPLVERVDSLLAAAENGPVSSERWELWRADLAALADFWRCGSGAGTHPAVYPRYLARQYPVRFTHAENSYLQVALETGVPGLIVLLSGVGMAVGWCLRSVRTARRSQDVLLASLLCGAVTATLVHNLVDFPWYVPACMAVNLVLLAALCRSGQMWLWSGWNISHGLSNPIRPGYVLHGTPRFWTTAATAMAAALVAAAGMEYGPVRGWFSWQDYLRRSASAANLLLVDSQEAQEAADQIIERLVTTVRHDPHHELAWLRLAAMELRRFELGQRDAPNAMNTAELRAALYAAEFPNGHQARQWLTKAVGANLVHLQRAAAAALQAARLSPWQGEAYVYLAETAFWFDPNPERRSELLDQAARVRPYNGEVLFALGLEQFERQRFREAVELWSTMFHSNPALREKLVQHLAGTLPTPVFVQTFLPDAESLWHWFERCRQLGLHDDARLAAEQYIAVRDKLGRHGQPVEDGRGWWRIADAYYFLGERDRSVELLQRAVEANPEELSWRVTLARRLGELGRWDEASEQLRYCLQRRPFDEELKQELAEGEKQRRLSSRPDVVRQSSTDSQWR